MADLSLLFGNVMSDFLKDMLIAFPEFEEIIVEYNNKEKEAFLLEFCKSIYPLVENEIKEKNEIIFQSPLYNTEFLPHIDFKQFWNEEGLSLKIKENIWNYLRVILITCVDSTDFQDLLYCIPFLSSSCANLTKEEEEKEDCGEDCGGEEEGGGEEEEKRKCTKEGEEEKNADEKVSDIAEAFAKGNQFAQGILSQLNSSEMSNLENIFRTSIQEFSSSPFFHQLAQQKEKEKEKEKEEEQELTKEEEKEKEFETIESTVAQDPEDESLPEEEARAAEGEPRNPGTSTSTSDKRKKKNSSGAPPVGMQEIDQLFGNLFGPTLVSFAKEIAEDTISNISPYEGEGQQHQSPEQIFQNPQLFSNILNNLNTKMSQKLESNELNETELLGGMKNFMDQFMNPSASSSSASSSSPEMSNSMQKMFGSLMQQMGEGGSGGDGGGGTGINSLSPLLSMASSLFSNALSSSSSSSSFASEETSSSSSSRPSPNQTNWYKQSKQDKIKQRIKNKILMKEAMKAAAKLTKEEKK